MVRIGKSGKTQRHGVAFCFVMLFSVFVCTFGCSKPSRHQEKTASGPVTLTIGWPFISGSDSLNGLQQAIPLLSNEGLVLIGRDGRPQPRLAQSWIESPDGLSWTIQLRPTAVFHDGSPVDSAAVKASLERTLSGPAREYSPGLTDIVSVETPNPTQVIIRLKNRSAFLLDDLNVAITKRGPDRKSIGTGPYLVTFTSPTEVVMSAFPAYYRGVPKIDRVVWKSYSTARTSWAAMMRGEIDFLYEVSPDALDFMRDEVSVREFSFLRNYVHAMVFNSKRPAFKDLRVRRALNYAIDRSTIVQQVFRGHGALASTPTWPQHWAYDSDLRSFDYDPARASALLDAANLPIKATQEGKSGPPGRLHFSLIFATNFALWERMALLIQRNLSQIGVDMQLETLSIDDFNERMGTGNFDAVLTDLVAGNAASRPYFYWYSTSKQNPFGYQNGRADQALDHLRYAGSNEDTRAAFRQFQSEMLDDPPGVFLAFGETTRAVSRRFDPVTPPGGDVFRTISEWRLAEAPVIRGSN